MSAIFGIISLSKTSNNEILGEKMIKGLNKYNFDKMSFHSWENIFMGCGLQFITPESKKEVLPRSYEEKGLYITADAILDNRSDLFVELNISEELFSEITDSELILKAYERWGQDCPKYLIGDYAFVIWNERKKELFCARDHVGKRTFYYYMDEERVVFSTIIKPILLALDNKLDLNERWIADFIALKGVVHEAEVFDTIYNNIHQLPPAHYMIISNNNVDITQFWNPIEEVKIDNSRTDEEVNEEFKKIFREAVKCRLRSDDGVGIMLSGGLDSGSIACIAAEELLNQGKSLKSYTAVPMDSFVNNLNNCYVADEREYIEEILNKYNNISPTFCNSNGKNSLSDVDDLLDILEQPYKTMENMFWVKEIVAKASEEGCRVLLDGQYGNCTISYGEFFTNVITLYKDRKLIKFAKEINQYSRLNNISRKKVAKVILRQITPKGIVKKFKSEYDSSNNIFDGVLVNKKLIEKWDIEKRFIDKELNLADPSKATDFYESRKRIFNIIAFSHIGTIESKLSLAYGIARRDPTRDKRIIEFCMSIPSDQFVRNGMGRYLIRRATEGILPDKIRLNYLTRGIQSADWLQRLTPEWDSIYKDLEKCVSSEVTAKYFDIDILKKELIEIKELQENHWGILRKLLYTLILSKFIEKASIVYNQLN